MGRPTVTIAHLPPDQPSGRLPRSGTVAEGPVQAREPARHGTAASRLSQKPSRGELGPRPRSRREIPAAQTGLACRQPPPGLIRGAIKLAQEADQLVAQLATEPGPRVVRRLVRAQASRPDGEAAEACTGPGELALNLAAQSALQQAQPACAPGTHPPAARQPAGLSITGRCAGHRGMRPPVIRHRRFKPGRQLPLQTITGGWVKIAAGRALAFAQTSPADERCARSP